MIYERIERRLGFKRVTTVTDTGEYSQRVEWDGGIITGVTKDNVLKMGWKSVNEFIANRPGFMPLVEVKQ